MENMTENERAQYGLDKSLNIQKTPYDFCSILHYSSSTKMEKKGKWKGVGCTLGQDNFRVTMPSVLDFQELNTMYRCESYEQLGTCADYFK